LAKSRADQGNIAAAIETATLVPQVTDVYEDAQQAIQHKLQITPFIYALSGINSTNEKAG
ncbi:hypothetical protein QHH11_29235, partial [Aphanizomenon sp. PH219]|nr:hypothetical protein [Aphanizomenon sp. PH219]